jgi:Mn-containing catalase
MLVNLKSTSSKQRPILRIFRATKLLTELPKPKHPDANAAAAVQELMGGKAGEMSTLMNYFFQTINFRDRDNYQPYYQSVANIAAEEWGHVELVASAINLLLTGTTTRGHRPEAKPLEDVPGFRNTYRFFAAGQDALRSIRWATSGTGATSIPAKA